MVRIRKYYLKSLNPLKTLEAWTYLEDISDEDGELPGVESGELLPALVARRAVVGVDGQEGQAHQPRVLGHRRRPNLDILRKIYRVSWSWHGGHSIVAKPTRVTKSIGDIIIVARQILRTWSVSRRSTSSYTSTHSSSNTALFRPCKKQQKHETQEASRNKKFAFQLNTDFLFLLYVSLVTKQSTTRRMLDWSNERKLK